MSEIPADFTRFSCPVPAASGSRVLMGHGGGGAMSQELLEQVFLPAFGNKVLNQLGDAAVLDGLMLAPGERLAFATDSYVVQPLVFPGGSIGELAIHGTVNDLAMSGAKPRFLSAGFIIEEGLPLKTLKDLVDRMGKAARTAGVAIVAGDTKVVEGGRGDGLVINTAGIGAVPAGVSLSPGTVELGDVILLSGTIADHGMAIMSVREGLGFEAEIVSDSAALHTLVADMLKACPELRLLRDPTRGGVAASLNELAAAAGLGIEIDEAAIPVAPPVAHACELLGLDPLQVANEGKLLAVVPAYAAAAMLAVMRTHEHGRAAVILGRVTSEHAGRVVLRTAIGGNRVIPLPIGEQLPRIC